jgi:hypothetical protein
MSAFLLAVSGFVLAMSVPTLLVIVAEGAATNGHGRFRRASRVNSSSVMQ